MRKYDNSYFFILSIKRAWFYKEIEYHDKGRERVGDPFSVIFGLVMIE